MLYASVAIMPAIRALAGFLRHIRYRRRFSCATPYFSPFARRLLHARRLPFAISRQSAAVAAAMRNVSFQASSLFSPPPLFEMAPIRRRLSCLPRLLMLLGTASKAGA